MSLADLENEVTGLPWQTCAVCHYMTEQDEDRAGRLRRLLSNRDVKFSDIAKELANDPDEPTIPHNALSRHARGICKAGVALR